MSVVKENIERLLASMTLEEKASLLVGSGWGSMLSICLLSSEKVEVPGAAGVVHSLGRLGIPAIVMADGPAGLRINPRGKGLRKKYFCTGFPVGTAIACSWNTALAEKVGSAMGNEALEYGVDVLLAPAMNIQRSPLCGRNFEYYSEDPLLSGKIAAATVRGVQSNGVGACIKHFAVNSQETNRLKNDARVDERTLREIYLKGFEIAVKESSPWTVMSSYNKINGVYAQENKWLLTDVLRGEWGYEGLVMTDWTEDRGNTAGQVAAGNDLMMPGIDTQAKHIIDSVRNGSLPEATLDACVQRVLELIAKTARFKGYEYSNKPDLASHAALCREAACEGMVLLENRNVLPLKDVRRVALYGTASYDFMAGGTGSGNVNKPYVVNVADGMSGAGFEVDASVEDSYRHFFRSRKNREKRYVMLGNAPWRALEHDQAEIEQAALRNDFAIYTISRQAGENQDRRVENDFELKDGERRNLERMCAAFHRHGKKVIVLLNVCGVIETASWKELPDAVLAVWGAGQEGGNSIADVLTGRSYPGGRLSMTFPVSYYDMPVSENYPSKGIREFRSSSEAMRGIIDDSGRKDIAYTEYQEGLNVGYRYFCGASAAPVSYPFGFGLSYTEFALSEAVAQVIDGALHMSVRCSNVGAAVGKEVVQVYVSAPGVTLEKPDCELRAFAKTRELAPGESEILEFRLPLSDLASFNPSSAAWEVEEGEYTIHFGSSAVDLLLNCKVNISIS